MLSNKIKTLISLGRTKQAIEDLCFIFSRMDDERELYSEILLISAGYEELQKNKRRGIIDFNTLNIELAKINYNLVFFIDQITGNTKIENYYCQDPYKLDAYTREIDLEGKEVNNYLVKKYIGSGGFGSVYISNHKFLGREVALKLSYRLLEEEPILDEIISVGINGLKLLNHPNIVRIHDIGKHYSNNEKRIYIVMDYVKGGNLREYLLKNNDLTKNEIQKRLNIFLNICEAIDYCHNVSYHHKAGFMIKGIQHGDIKPENILLDNGKPYLIDFMFINLKKLYKLTVKEPLFLRREFFAASMIIGTYGYMAPEQKEHGIVTERTDIYSLGVLLLELFSNLKISSNSFITFNTKEEVSNVISNQNIPNYIIDIIFKATKLNEEQRYNDVKEMINILKK